MSKIQKRGASALANYEAEMAQQAEAAATQEAASGGGQFFSVRGGQLSFAGAPIEGNEMAVIVLDGILSNTFYSGKFDPENPSSPVCYAFGRDEATLAPHKDSSSPQSEGCAVCPQNTWASADTGRGKACKNSRRLALIPAGELNSDGTFSPYEEPAHFEKSPIGFLNVPVTSVNGYAAWVKSIAATTRRPPHGVFARVAVLPDDKTQVKVTFETLGPVPGELLPAIMERHKATRELIAFPFPKFEEGAQAPKRAAPRRATPAKSAPKKPTATAKPAPTPVPRRAPAADAQPAAPRRAKF